MATGADQVETLYKRADEAFKKHSYDYARDLFRQILTFSPDHEKAHEAEGRFLHHLREWHQLGGQGGGRDGRSVSVLLHNPAATPGRNRDFGPLLEGIGPEYPSRPGPARLVADNQSLLDRLCDARIRRRR